MFYVVQFKCLSNSRGFDLSNFSDNFLPRLVINPLKHKWIVLSNYINSQKCSYLLCRYRIALYMLPKMGL